MPYPVFLAFLVFWGVVVVGDSPRSALNARYAPTRLVGSALTIVNCIGFAITIVSIQLLNNAVSTIGARYLFPCFSFPDRSWVCLRCGTS